MARPKINTIAIVIKPQSQKVFSIILPNLINWMKRRKIQVHFRFDQKDLVEKHVDSKTIKHIEFIKNKKFYGQSQLVIVLGGDGTLIGTCRRMGNSKVPIFGVNLGHLGFISEFTKHDFFEDLVDYFHGKLRVESKTLCKAEVYRKGELVFKEYFLNDAVLTKQDISRMFSLSLEINDEHVYNILGDGLIVSTPTGSTAYSLAAGGPIIHPNVSSFTLTPICPHSLSHRAMVIPDKDPVCIKLNEKHDNLVLTVDGQSATTVMPKDVVIIKKDSRKIRFVINPRKTFFHTLKQKLNLGRRD